jgi:hypothetical protein
MNWEYPANSTGRNKAMRRVQEEADADSQALAFRSRFAAAAAIFNADFLVVAGVFFIASNIACFKFLDCCKVSIARQGDSPSLARRSCSLAFS